MHPFVADFALPEGAATVFLLLTLPVCIWVAVSDLRFMKIRNRAVLALIAIFLLSAPVVLPLSQVFWQLVNGAVVLVIGFLLNMVRALGAGDAKFLAAAAPYVMLSDALNVILMLTVVLLAALILHRLARAIGPVRRLAPEWESWSSAKFPMGLGLGPTLSLYLALAAFG